MACSDPHSSNRQLRMVRWGNAAQIICLHPLALAACLSHLSKCHAVAGIEVCGCSLNARSSAASLSSSRGYASNIEGLTLINKGLKQGPGGRSSVRIVSSSVCCSGCMRMHLLLCSHQPEAVLSSNQHLLSCSQQPKRCAFACRSVVSLQQCLAALAFWDDISSTPWPRLARKSLSPTDVMIWTCSTSEPWATWGRLGPARLQPSPLIHSNHLPSHMQLQRDSGRVSGSSAGTLFRGQEVLCHRSMHLA